MFLSSLIRIFCYLIVTFHLAVKPFTRGDDVPLYADGFGYLLLAENSISELNKRLKENDVNDLEVEETRFRPNIYISGDMSY